MEENRIIRIDLTNNTIKEEQLKEEWKHLGGRGLTSTIISEEVPPTCHPLSTENKLVFAPGLISGTTLSSSNRLSVGGKSPMTGGIKEANSGGVAAYRLARLGIKALILEGRVTEKDKWVGIHIDANGISIESLDEYKDVYTWETSDKLIEKYGKNTGVISIGPAGEKRMPIASIHITDIEGEPCRVAARGGLGAVMGSKGVKAITVNDKDSTVRPGKSEAAKAAIKKFNTAVRENPVTGDIFGKLGTARTLGVVNDLGGLPTRNFSQGSFEKADDIGGQALYDTITSRGGLPTHACMPGCLIRCSNKYVSNDGTPVVGSVDYETLCLLGSNIGIGNLDHIAHLNRLCNDIGLDTIEAGVTIGVLCDAGVMDFGDYKRAVELLEAVPTGSPLGTLVGAGSVVCAKAYGVERIPATKGQGMAAYDPRVIKGQGVTYATTPMGADHTAGNAIVAQGDHKDPTGKVQISVDLQLFTAVQDNLGLCIFTTRPINEDMTILEDAVKGIAGWDTTIDELKAFGKSIIVKEHEFNLKAGISPEADRLPGFMRTEALPPNNLVFEMDEDEFQTVWS